MSDILAVDDIHKRYGGVRALDGCTFRVREGSITGLIGPNGAGKTTLFDVVTGHQRPDQGTVHLSGRRIDRLPAHRLARMGIARTFQLVRLLPRLSAIDNLVIAAPGHPGETTVGALSGSWRAAEARLRDDALEWLRFVGMAHRKDVPAGNLSYGQSKLSEIARALTMDARLLLLDEPMSGINPTLRKEILAAIHKVRDEEGKTFVVIEHDIEMIMAECDEIVVMHQGRVLMQGTPDDVQNDPRVAQAYLGGEHGPADEEAEPT